MRQQQHLLSAKPVVTALSSYPSNGHIHSQYLGYHVKTDVKVPPHVEPAHVEDDLHPSSLARLPSLVKEIRTPAMKFQPDSSALPVLPKINTKPVEPSKPIRQELTKPKSLAETKKASVEIMSESIVEETVS